MKAKWIKSLAFCLALETALVTAFAADSLELPSGLAQIGAGAFENTASIDEVVIGINVRRIESRAFAGSSVKLVIFPEGCCVEYIAPDAFEGTAGVQFSTGGNQAALSYIGTCGVTEYKPRTAEPDEKNYAGTIVLPIIPF